MPLIQKIKVACLAIGWLALCILSFILAMHLGVSPALSIVCGPLPLILIALYALYLFYPKFNLMHDIKFDPMKKLVALTFDDGPTSGFTDEILNILDEKNVKATFFMLGNKIPANKDIVEDTIRRGHDVGAHTLSHKKLHLSSKEDIVHEAGDSIALARALYEGLGVTCKPMFRSPHGFKNITLTRYLKENAIPLVHWTRGVWDTDAPGAKWIFEKSTVFPQENEILLFHDGLGMNETVSQEQKDGLLEALPKIIDFYKNKGYTFIKVIELTK